MSKIKNMGNSTMKFGEGIIVSGSAFNPDGTTSNYSTVISGNTLLSGSLRVSNSFTFPATDGLANQYLKTNGDGQLSWSTVSGGAESVRTIEVDGDGDGTSEYTLDPSENLVLKAGTNISLKESAGVVTIDSLYIKPLVRDVEFPSTNINLSTAGIDADVYCVDCNIGNKTVTLPAPSSAHRGKQITFIKNAGGNTLTITAGTNKITDQSVSMTNYVISGHLRNVTLICIDFTWLVVAEA